MRKEKTRLFESGKLPPDVLFHFLKTFPSKDPRVVIGPKAGVDASVIDEGDRFLLVTTDPITFTTENIGWYAVCINANDIAVMGGSPRWFLADLLLPEGNGSRDIVRSIFDDLKKACRKMNVTLCGGHTEITPSVKEPVICGTMIGEVEKNKLVTSAGAKPGDALILTKGLAIEGTAILARECHQRLMKKFPPILLERAKRFLFNPGISVVKDARIALRAGKVTAMHDPTEGGVATALKELADASQVGLSIEEDALFLFRETDLICQQLGIDPLGLISSGSLLIACEARDAEKMARALKSARIKSAIIGKALPHSKGLNLVRRDGINPLPMFPRDELARFFSENRLSSRVRKYGDA
ncbi:AIR synthase family protein [Candidatus Sumerlaeota bacterium]|nr:AIR synthase family protein [Candidatus Sumerlaeota bacterium]